MKKLFFFWFYSFMICQLLAQPFEKKQITNFNYDSRGASFPIYPVGLTSSQTSLIFFEAHESNNSNIMMMSYDSVTDSFFNPLPITQNNFLNINPIADASHNWNGDINLIWQTNKNGNWDIVLKTLTDSNWSDEEFIINSQANEMNPKFILGENRSSSPAINFEIVYEMGNSVCLYQRTDSIILNEIVFSGNDTIAYSQPSGIYLTPNIWTQTGGLFIAAARKVNDYESIIVYRYKSYYDSSWSVIYTAYDSGYCDNPKFCNLYWGYPFLSFEVSVQDKKQVYVIPEFGYPGQVLDAVPLIDDLNVKTSDFSFFVYGIIGKLAKNIQYSFYGPHSYKITSNDSVYIFRPISYRNLEENFYTKVSDTRIGVGNLGWEYQGHVSYIIWEDSANGHINLYGVKRLDQLGDVNDKIIANNFILYQNYPNPFNPKTVIKYKLLSRDFVTLKVYNVLGKEVSTLINEEQTAGEYQSTFDASNLASGIYMYRVSVGKNHLSKKMILLK